jgi:hypothetical protein
MFAHSDLHRRRRAADDTWVDGATATALGDMVIGDALGAVPLGTQFTVLLLMIGCALWASQRTSPLAVLAFVACAAMWSRANQALEGAILLSLNHEHGITTADLWPPALAALVIARHQRGRWREGLRGKESGAGRRDGGPPARRTSPAGIQSRRVGPPGGVQETSTASRVQATASAGTGVTSPVDQRIVATTAMGEVARVTAPSGTERKMRGTLPMGQPPADDRWSSTHVPR